MGPTKPMGFPWEWERKSELDGNGDGNDSTGMGGNRTVPVKRQKINNALLSNTNLAALHLE
jgi:hypothetical protein